MVIRSLRRTAAAGLPAVLALTVGTAAGAPTALAASGWQPAEEMNVAHRAHGAALLPDGDVLVISGFSNAPGEVPEVERYDVATGRWSLAAPLPDPRHYATATALADGSVLLAGGRTTVVTTRSDLFDPVAGTWNVTPGGFMNVERNGHAAVRLDDGRALVMGGADSARNATPSAELYDPVTGIWSLTGDLMSDGREEPQAALLADGRVLAAGGFDQTTSTTFAASADLYDPATGSWTPTAPMRTARAQGAGVALRDGRMLVAGGDNRLGFVRGIELYDPATDTWSDAGEVPAAGNVTRGAVLDDGRVLLHNDGSRSTWLFDPASDSITRTFESGAARTLSSLTVLRDGRALIAGGSNFRSAELFTPPTERHATGGDFGRVTIPGIVERDAEIENAGGNRLWIDAAALTGRDAADYAIVADGCSGAELLPGERCTVRLRFAPSDTGARLAQLTFDDNAETSPALALEGSGHREPEPPDPPRPPTPEPDPPRPPVGEPPAPQPVLRAPAIERFTLDRRCVRPTRAGRVQVGLGLRLTRAARVRIQVARALGTKGRSVCPPRGRGSFDGELGRPLALTRGSAPTAVASAAVGRHTLTLKLRPALYRITVRPYDADGRLGRPAHRWLRVLAPR